MVMLKRWEPFAELRRLERDVDPFWGHRFPLDRMWPAPWGWDRRLPIDLYQEADKVVVKAAIPGVKLEDLDLTVADNTLAIKVEAKSEDEVKEEEYLSRERRYGTFRRLVSLPDGLAVDKADASYEDGVLTVTFPRTEESRPRSLKINVGKSKK